MRRATTVDVLAAAKQTRLERLKKVLELIFNWWAQLDKPGEELAADSIYENTWQKSGHVGKIP